MQFTLLDGLKYLLVTNLKNELMMPLYQIL